jgi:hypothetical protein
MQYNNVVFDREGYTTNVNGDKFADYLLDYSGFSCISRGIQYDFLTPEELDSITSTKVLNKLYHSAELKAVDEMVNHLETGDFFHAKLAYTFYLQAFDARLVSARIYNDMDYGHQKILDLLRAEREHILKYILDAKHSETHQPMQFRFKSCELVSNALKGQVRMRYCYMPLNYPVWRQRQMELGRSVA